MLSSAFWGTVLLPLHLVYLTLQQLTFRLSFGRLQSRKGMKASTSPSWRWPLRTLRTSWWLCHITEPPFPTGQQDPRPARRLLLCVGSWPDVTPSGSDSEAGGASSGANQLWWLIHGRKGLLQSICQAPAKPSFPPLPTEEDNGDHPMSPP